MKNKSKKKYNYFLSDRGFTLIELMVSLSVFMGIMIMAMGSLFVSLDAIKKVRAQQSAMDNVNFAMDSMARYIRTGTKYHCADTPVLMTDTTSTRDCPADESVTAVSFLPQSSKIYRLAYIQKERADGTHTIKRCKDDTGNCPEIVAPNVDIERLNFVVRGANPSDDLQPSVFIIMKGTVTVKGVPISFAIQTMASQRNIEY